MKMPSASMPVLRGKLTSSVTPMARPTTIIGAMRTTSAFTAWRRFSSPTRSELARSTTENIASANVSGTRWVASGIVMSAEPNPVIP